MEQKIYKEGLNKLAKKYKTKKSPAKQKICRAPTEEKNLKDKM